MRRQLAILADVSRTSPAKVQIASKQVWACGEEARSRAGGRGALRNQRRDSWRWARSPREGARACSQAVSSAASLAACRASQHCQLRPAPLCERETHRRPVELASIANGGGSLHAHGAAARVRTLRARPAQRAGLSLREGGSSHTPPPPLLWDPSGTHLKAAAASRSATSCIARERLDAIAAPGGCATAMGVAAAPNPQWWACARLARAPRATSSDRWEYPPVFPRSCVLLRRGSGHHGALPHSSPPVKSGTMEELPRT